MLWIIFILVIIYLLLEIYSGSSDDVRIIALCEDFQGNTYRVKSKVEGYFKTEERIKRQVEDEFYLRKGIHLRSVKLIKVV